jgi:hypothetical protein
MMQKIETVLMKIGKIVRTGKIYIKKWSKFVGICENQ